MKSRSVNLSFLGGCAFQNSRTALDVSRSVSALTVAADLPCGDAAEDPVNGDVPVAGTDSFVDGLVVVVFDSAPAGDVAFPADGLAEDVAFTPDDSAEDVAVAPDGAAGKVAVAPDGEVAFVPDGPAGEVAFMPDGAVDDLSTLWYFSAARLLEVGLSVFDLSFTCRASAISTPSCSRFSIIVAGILLQAHYVSASNTRPMHC